MTTSATYGCGWLARPPSKRFLTIYGPSNRARPGLREALAAWQAGDALVAAKLDRLAGSFPDARDIVDKLTARGVRLNRGGSIHDPADPVGRLLFNVLATVTAFEADLTRSRTREGMAVAKAKGRLRGKLKPRQEAHLVVKGGRRRAAPIFQDLVGAVLGAED